MIVSILCALAVATLVLSCFKGDLNTEFITINDTSKVVGSYDATEDMIGRSAGDKPGWPSNNDLQELTNEENTPHTWLTFNGCSGYAFRSRKEGYTNRFIFLPANGIISPSYQAPNNAGISGFYWSRTVDDRVADISFYLHFTKHGSITIESENTSSRLSLRKVVSKQLN